MGTPFYKCNGNGNTFIIIVSSTFKVQNLISKNKIKNVCYNIEDSIIDGFISANVTDDKVIMNYYNNDGSWETFCLNGLRCLALVLYKKYNKHNFSIYSNNTLYNCKVLDDQVIEVELGEPSYVKKNIKIEKIIGDYIDSGTKHFVYNQSNQWSDDYSLKLEMQNIRNHYLFEPEGINVNYYKIIGENTIEVKTYEKGIEKIMQSCASGSYACAYDYSKKNNINGKIKVLNDGGISQITFSKSYKKNKFRAVASIEYQSEIEI